MLIEAVELSHVYMPGSPSQAVAIDGVTLSVGEGEFVGVIGHTGSGKSTLVQHMNGLLRPSGGTIAVDGVAIPQKGGDMRAVRRVVGMVFQYPEYQLFEETVEKDIAFGPKNLGLEGDELDARVRAAMEDVGLQYELFAPRSPFELSGGQKRRVAIAGVLAMQPRVLVLDEPTAGLDPRGRAEILDLVSRFRQRGNTVIMISHNMDDIAKYCSRVVVMAGGRLLLDGAPDEVFSHADELRANGLDLPSAASIAGMLTEAGIAIPPGVVTARQLEEAILAAMGGDEHGDH
jgi:energy-coupling factor transport system ATP-binding protein